MKARKLLENATLGPADLKIVSQAFDQAWEQIKGRYQTNALAFEAARIRLATAVLAGYRVGLLDPNLIRARALDDLGH
jgi:hypothetical protein